MARAIARCAPRHDPATKGEVDLERLSIRVRGSRRRGPKGPGRRPLVMLRRSKTDQEGEGRYVAIPHGLRNDTCPVRAVEIWLNSAAITEGHVFRPVRKGGSVCSTRLTGHAIASVVKRYANGAGLPVDSFSGHSLRAGFVTSAARAGEPERRIMRQTGHKSIEMVLRYVRQANAFTDNAVCALGL
jgi:integrase